ncbi:universal stress protein [Spongiactinospora sp. TRM90649]|uniref:universal stress protein n=1 Tax=Spongiactinospora sp. TRM90649 TaxID=3031114 RepID=UPI0023F6F858|nr:universal stress protein [Spongiactinospora sp. TRM90649]MDF5754249.1 universal stress protein [Spongiactinospora sp. TRM90649]
MTRTDGVLVGYDGSDFSTRALEWAMDEAELREVPLTVLHTWHWPYDNTDPQAKAHLRETAEHVLGHGAGLAGAHGGPRGVRAELREGPASARLAEMSADAGLLVVGSRGLGRRAQTVLGSVAEHVAGHADCPVIVIRGQEPKARVPGPVVLALGDSTGDEVVGFAFGEAERRGVELLAVRAGAEPLISWGTPGGPAPAIEAAIRAGERATAERLLAHRAVHPDVRVAIRYTTLTPRQAVRDCSIGATLLVLGTGASPERLGPVAGYAVQFAPCPVALVPRKSPAVQALQAAFGADIWKDDRHPERDLSL